MNLSEKAQIIKDKALQLGFDSVGIVKAEFLSDQKKFLENWLEKYYFAEMLYMTKNFEKRLDPTILFENTKSIVVVLKNYYQKHFESNDGFKISNYALGQDYHFVIKKDLSLLLEFINKTIQISKGRCFVDSAPILEKALAKKAGLGWIGKNSLLLTKKGSFFFIGLLFLDFELNEDKPFENSYCGNCSLCIDACPSKAIVSPFILDANKCISYQTIEKKDKINLLLENKNEKWIFGCDICQNVCPWNKKSKLTTEKLFENQLFSNNINNIELKKLTINEFNNTFAKSSVKRINFQKFISNIDFYSK